MNYDIVIEKINESFIRVDADRSILYELRDLYTFQANNYKFHPMYKKGIWDGNIRLFNVNNRMILAGLAGDIVKWARARDYKIDVKNPSSYIENFTEDDAKSFVKTLSVPNHINERDYQIEAFVDNIRRKRNGVLSPTSSGKSFLIYLTLRKILDMLPGEQGLLVVPTTSLVEQMYTDFESYGFDVEKYCHRVHSGHKTKTGSNRDTTKPIIITTWQSIQRQDKEWFHTFSFIIGDEAHHFQAKALSYIMENLINAEYRIGTTGTLDDAVVNELTLTGHFGPFKEYITTHQLMERGLISNLEVKAIVLNHSQEVKNIRKEEKWKYVDEMNYLMASPSRNKFLVSLSLKLEGNTLILFNQVEKHGHILRDMFDDIDHNKEVFYIHGSISTKEREDIRKYVNNNNNCIILASYGTFSTGINLPNLQNSIFAIGFKSKIRVLQSIGRTLRLDNKDNKATLYDIGDDITVGTVKNFSLKHFNHRVVLYFKQLFNVKVINVYLNNLNDKQ